MCLHERFALPAHRPDRGLVPHRAPQRAAGAWNETGSVTFRVRSNCCLKQRHRLGRSTANGGIG
jgi:hypothetical protein